MELIDLFAKGLSLLKSLDNPKTTAEKVVSGIFDTTKYGVKTHILPPLQDRINIFKGATTEEVNQGAEQYAKRPDFEFNNRE